MSFPPPPYRPRDVTVGWLGRDPFKGRRDEGKRRRDKGKRCTRDLNFLCAPLFPAVDHQGIGTDSDMGRRYISGLQARAHKGSFKKGYLISVNRGLRAAP